MGRARGWEEPLCWAAPAPFPFKKTTSKSTRYQRQVHCLLKKKLLSLNPPQPSIKKHLTAPHAMPAKGCSLVHTLHTPQSCRATGTHEPSPRPPYPAPAQQPAFPAPRRPHAAAGGGAGRPFESPWHGAGGGAGCASCSWCREGMQKAPRSPAREDGRGLGHCVGSGSETGDMDVTLAPGEGTRKLINRIDAWLSPRWGGHSWGDAPEKGLHIGTYWGNLLHPPPRIPETGGGGLVGVWGELCFCSGGERVGAQLRRAQSTGQSWPGNFCGHGKGMKS